MYMNLLQKLYYHLFIAHDRILYKFFSINFSLLFYSLYFISLLFFIIICLDEKNKTYFITNKQKNLKIFLFKINKLEILYLFHFYNIMYYNILLFLYKFCYISFDIFLLNYYISFMIKNKFL